VGLKRKRGRSGDRIVGKSRGKWGKVRGFDRKREKVMEIPAWSPPVFRDPIMLLPSDIMRARKPALRRT